MFNDCTKTFRQRCGAAYDFLMVDDYWMAIIRSSRSLQKLGGFASCSMGYLDIFLLLLCWPRQVFNFIFNCDVIAHIGDGEGDGLHDCLP